jgi:Zn-dependent protease/CBS domain-containing protein
MTWSFPIGRVRGIPIRIHLTFVILLAWIAWLGWQAGGLQGSLWALALIVGLFACIVLHELGHSLVAVHFGSDVRSVTLLPIGGVASMKSIPRKPSQELLVSLAGPSVNVVIALILSAARGGFPGWGGADAFPRNGLELVDSLIRTNIVLAVFNLIPAFPMDGGRVLRSLLALVLPYPRATGVATALGQLVAVAFILTGLVLNPFLVLIGVFVFLGAESEERSVRVGALLRNVLAEDVMVTDVVVLRPEDTLGRCLEYVYHRKREDFVVETDGKLVGVLARKDWLEALHREGAGAPVGAVMRRHFMLLHPKAPLARLYQDLWRLEQGVFPVVSDGRVLGLLTGEDISRYLLVQEARKHVPPPASPPGGAVSGASRFVVDLG